MANFGPFGAPFRPGVLLQPQDIEDRSHELRLSSSSTGPLHWTAGVYYEEREAFTRSEEHTSELQSLAYLVCRLLLEKKNNPTQRARPPPSDPPRRPLSPFLSSPPPTPPSSPLQLHHPYLAVCA